MQSTIDTVFAAAMSLPTQDRATLTDRLLETYPTALPTMTDELRAELDRRWADHEANPDDVVTWEEIQAAAMARIKR